MAFLLAAISLGFLGSFHCVGMCGPIALALPVHNKPPLTKKVLILLYNLGRILTYSVFGLLAGSIGEGFVVAGFQQTLSIVIGIVLLISVFFSFNNWFSGYGFFLRLKNSISRRFLNGRPSSLFTIGMLNGLLPCGLVYLGIAGAAATGDVLRGVLFMAAFGLGTAPMMFILPLIGSSIPMSARNGIRRATPVVVGIVAALLIIRGLDLGIPYLSPKMNQNEVACCHKDNSPKKTVIKCCKPSSSKDQCSK